MEHDDGVAIAPAGAANDCQRARRSLPVYRFRCSPAARGPLPSWALAVAVRVAQVSPAAGCAGQVVGAVLRETRRCFGPERDRVAVKRPGGAVTRHRSYALPTC